MIEAEEIIIGKNVIISPTAKIRGINGKAKKIVIGDNTYIGDNVQIILDEFEIGDYCKVHHHNYLLFKEIYQKTTKRYSTV